MTPLHKRRKGGSIPTALISLASSSSESFFFLLLCHQLLLLFFLVGRGLLAGDLMLRPVLALAFLRAVTARHAVGAQQVSVRLPADVADERLLGLQRT